MHARWWPGVSVVDQQQIFGYRLRAITFHSFIPAKAEAFYNSASWSIHGSPD
jgi:hypothetical protein